MMKRKINSGWIYGKAKKILMVLNLKNWVPISKFIVLNSKNPYCIIHLTSRRKLKHETLNTWGQETTHTAIFPSLGIKLAYHY